MALKYRMLAESLKEEIARRGPLGEKKLPSEAELMRSFHVSRQTVRQALSVLQEEGMIEKRQGSGTFISSSVFPDAFSSDHIAVLIPDVFGYQSSLAIRNIQAVFDPAGFSTQIYNTENRTGKEREILQSLLEKPVRGILVSGVRTAMPNPNLALYQELMARGTFIVFLGNGYPELIPPGTDADFSAVSIRQPAPSRPSRAAQKHSKNASPLQEAQIRAVTFDDFAGGGLLAKYLISHGHKNIAGIFRLDNLSGKNYYAGILHALAEDHLSFDDRNFLWYDPLTANSRDSKWLLPFIRITLSHCTAVICQDIAVAQTLSLALRKLDLSVPQRIWIAAFSFSGTRQDLMARTGLIRPDDSKYTDITCAVLPEVNPPKMAAELLLSLIRGAKASSVRIPWILQQEESAGNTE